MIKEPVYLWSTPNHPSAHLICSYIDEGVDFNGNYYIEIQCGMCQKRHKYQNEKKVCPHCNNGLVFPREEW